jgi:hypothetical protein
MPADVRVAHEEAAVMAKCFVFRLGWLAGVILLIGLLWMSAC